MTRNQPSNARSTDVELERQRRTRGNVLYGLTPAQARRVDRAMWRLLDQANDDTKLQDAIAAHEDARSELKRLGGPTCAGLH